MNVTSFAVGGRDSALLIGDYNTYRSQLSRQLLAVRKRLGRATAKNAKYQHKAPITAENVGQNHEYAHLLLLSAERAWAHAMHMKTSRTEESQGITGSTRSHIISRLHKAAKCAGDLVHLLEDQTASKATDTDILEARAYRSSLVGAGDFEKQSEGQKTKEELANKERWNSCLQEYSSARVIYAALLAKSNKDVFRDILANTVDPTIRYAAYQARLSRTIAISSVAIRYFPKDDTKLVELVKQQDAKALTEQKSVASNQAPSITGEIPDSISWRGRRVNIVDASIGQALAQASAAESRLSSFLASKTEASQKEKAAAYDDVLIARQDAADATRRAIEELEKERVSESDARIQDLRRTNLAVNYDLVSWRAGRNRVLIGSEDGRLFSEPNAKRTKRPRKDGKEVAGRTENRAKKLARLRERVVLYDATIQSIDSLKDLPGAKGDASFMQELEGRRSYFQALKCLNIALSHTLLSSHLNALALFARAGEYASKCVSSLPASTRGAEEPLTLEIESSQAKALQAQLQHQIYRHQALADIYKFHANASTAAAKNLTSAAPLVQRLHDYPTPGANVDLKNLVSYPPKIEPVPVKPLFLDVAWNYIDYPGRAVQAVEQAAAAPAAKAAETAREEPREEKKKGWFGFGR